MRATHTTTLAALTLLAAASLAALPQAAHAQMLTLNDGDVVTVNSIGTVGIINKLPVANATTSYSSSSSFLPAVQTNGTSTFSLGTGGTITAEQNVYVLFAGGSGLVTITGGTITAGQSGGGLGSFSGTVTVTGGTITAGSGGYGLVAQNSGAIDLYGSFTGYAPGTNTNLANGAGSFFGTLQNNTVGQTFTYLNNNRITLHALAPAPEPSQFATLAIGLLGLGALAIKAKKRTA